jgi:protein gp37
MLWHRVKGYLLADDVGLGKTASSIAGLTDPSLLPAVVVTLAHLPRQWQQEIEKFAPQLTTHIIKKGTPYKITKGSLPGVEGFPDVIIINYHKLAGWAETLAGLARSLIFDEVQELRRSESNKYMAARTLAYKAGHRIGLSATPIYNYGGEFYNVINILAPGKLGTREEFYREWCGYGFGDKATIKDPKAFGAYLKESGVRESAGKMLITRNYMGKTNIQYSDEISNPLQVVDKLTGKKGTHCEKPDPQGTCRDCWAETLNTRGGPDNKRFGTGLTYDKSNRDRVEWFKHEKEMHRLANLNGRTPMSEKFPGNPLIVFTNDTYDLFQPSIGDELRDWVFNNYDTFVNLTLLIQTTYVSRMAAYLTKRYPDGMPHQYFIGMSAGTQKFLEDNYRNLLAVPARRRYIIFEPLLERIDAARLEVGAYELCNYSAFRRSLLNFVNLLIIGGESGSNARNCDAAWIRSLVTQGKRFDNVSILVKQLGTKAYCSFDHWFRPGSIVVPVDSQWWPNKIKDRKGGDIDEFPADLRIREFPSL